MDKNSIENVTEEVTEEVKELTGEVANDAKEKVSEIKRDIQKNKYLVAKSKIEAAADRIKSTDDDIEECISKIESDLATYKDIEQKFVDSTLKSSQMFLKDLGVADRVIESAPEPKIDLSDPEVKPVQIKKITRGRFKGFLLGLLAALAALGGWCYSATQALGLPLIPDKIPDMDRITKLLEWTSGKLGQGANASVGGAAIIIGVLAIAFLVYWIVKALTTSSNLRTAKRIEEDTEFYCTKKGECKEQMEKVREHIAQAKQLIHKYNVLLGEQNAKIKRALFVEEADQYDKLHAKTQTEIRKIKKLASEVERFLETPMAEHGILSKEGIETLTKVNKAANDHIMEIYG